ncbi:MAG: DUF2953 domain-containing protein, partial [Bacillota bacterium]
TTFQDELIKLDQLTLSNPILLRIISTLLLSIEGRCEKLVWRTKFGIKNPALTGVATGLLWIIKSNLYSFLHHRAAEVAKPKFAVLPNFNQVNELDVEFESIFSLRLGKIISRGTIIIINRYTRRLFKNGRSSN